MITYTLRIKEFGYSIPFSYKIITISSLNSKYVSHYGAEVALKSISHFTESICAELWNSERIVLRLCSKDYQSFIAITNVKHKRKSAFYMEKRRCTQNFDGQCIETRKRRSVNRCEKIMNKSGSSSFNLHT